MPNRILIDHPGALHFITFSTHQRRRFLAPGQARNIVLETLQISLENHHAQCHGFVIMPDHVHAIFSVQPDKTIASFLQSWKKTSSYRINDFYSRNHTLYHDCCPNSCPIWQAKFYDYNLESDEKFLEKLDYMHANPVTAGLAPTILDWPWSSAPFYELGQPVGVTITQSH